jgi:hypothetical protein
MGKQRLRLVRPAPVNRTVTPRRLPNAELRTREHLTEREVERLIDVAKDNRHGQRDATMTCWPIGTAYARRSCATFAGIRWTSIEPSCTSVESSKARLQRIL